ncbi:MAG: malate dehydrogenase, partial [gamma proteobacterium symbiont of Phacoides pectinatus]
RGSNGCRVGESILGTGMSQNLSRGSDTLGIQRRGAEIIEARGLSSAASAADAVVDHVRDWALGTPEGDWVSMSVISDGSYGVAEGIVFSFPVTCAGGEYRIVQGLDLDALSCSRLKKSEQELLGERAVVGDLLGR